MDMLVKVKWISTYKVFGTASDTKKMFKIIRIIILLLEPRWKERTGTLSPTSHSPCTWAGHQGSGPWKRAWFHLVQLRRLTNMYFTHPTLLATTLPNIATSGRKNGPLQYDKGFADHTVEAEVEAGSMR